MLSDDDKRSIAQECYLDPALFCTTFLSHWFKSPLKWFQRGMLAVLLGRAEWLLKHGQVEKIARNFFYLDANKAEQRIFDLEYDSGKVVGITLRKRRFTQIRIPRGFSKTTICNAAILIKIVYLETKVTGYLSETATHSEQQLMNIRREFESNNKLINVYGSLVPGPGEGRWKEDLLETTNGVRVFARGRGAQIRGTNFEGIRPDCLILDDVEDKESVKTPEQREKARDWAYSDVFPALAELDEGSTVIVLGTLLHSEALLTVFERDPQFVTIAFEVKDRDGEWLWPEMMDDKKYELRKRSFAAAGQLSKFYLEYHNSVRGDDNQKFKPSYIIIEPRPMSLQTAIALDPAISEKRGSDFAAIGVVGMSDKGLVWVLDVWMKVGAPPREQIDEYFTRSQTFGCVLHGVESIAFQAAIIHLMREEMFRKKQYFEITPITHKQKKEERVEGILQPRYAAGFMRHARHFELYEGQLLDWPNGKKDGPDVVSMAVSLLDPYAASAYDPGAGKKLEEDIYEPLTITEFGA